MVHGRISQRLLAFPAIVLAFFSARGLAAPDDFTEFHEIDVEATVRQMGPDVIPVGDTANLLAVGDCDILRSEPDSVITPVHWTVTLVGAEYKMSRDGPWVAGIPGVDYVTDLTEDDCVDITSGDASHIEIPFTFRPIGPGYWNIMVTVSAVYDEEPADQSTQGPALDSVP